MRQLLLAMAFSAFTAAQSPGSFAFTGEMSVPRVYHSATLLQDGRVLVAGGMSFKMLSSIAHLSAELYDPATGRFTSTGEMNAPRSGRSATLLPNGEVLMVGGWWGQNLFGDAELYDPLRIRFGRSRESFPPSVVATRNLAGQRHRADHRRIAGRDLRSGYRGLPQGFLHFLPRAVLLDLPRSALL